VGHIPTKLHQFPIISFRDFLRTDSRTDGRRTKQYLLAARAQVTRPKQSFHQGLATRSRTNKAKTLSAEVIQAKTKAHESTMGELAALSRQ